MKYGLSPTLGAMVHILLPPSQSILGIFFYYLAWSRRLKMLRLEGHLKGYMTTTLQSRNTLRVGRAKGGNSDWALNRAGCGAAQKQDAHQMETEGVMRDEST